MDSDQIRPAVGIADPVSLMIAQRRDHGKTERCLRRQDCRHQTLKAALTFPVRHQRFSVPFRQGLDKLHGTHRPQDHPLHVILVPVVRIPAHIAVECLAHCFIVRRTLTALGHVGRHHDMDAVFCVVNGCFLQGVCTRSPELGNGGQGAGFSVGGHGKIAHGKITFSAIQFELPDPDHAVFVFGRAGDFLQNRVHGNFIHLCDLCRPERIKVIRIHRACFELRHIAEGAFHGFAGGLPFFVDADGIQPDPAGGNGNFHRTVRRHFDFGAVLTVDLESAHDLFTFTGQRGDLENDLFIPIGIDTFRFVGGDGERSGGEQGGGTGQEESQDLFHAITLPLLLFSFR